MEEEKQKCISSGKTYKRSSAIAPRTENVCVVDNLLADIKKGNFKLRKGGNENTRVV